MIVQLAAAFAGSFAFSLLFNVRKNLLLLSSLGGTASWAVYLVLDGLGTDTFVSVFIASVAAGVYAELLARIKKAPDTVFLIPAAVPLVPGSSLYHMMSSAVAQDAAMMRYWGITTLRWAIAIALGASAVKVYYIAAARLSSRLKAE